MKFIIIRLLLIAVIVATTQFNLQAQTEPSREGNPDNFPVHEYNLTIDQETVNLAGKAVPGMTINGGIPGPILRFREGEYAVIHVTNNMDTETSVHWHGILLPNFYDGVPYLTTPPIKPGETFKYEFALNQSGTYWYHSHTMLQEQKGVFGSIVIEPKEKTLEYDRDLVMVLSDWTNEKPMSVLRNLKRGNEWYGIKKGTANPLGQVIGRGALGAQINFWRQRMEGADIADVYYEAFLVNGKPTVEHPEFKPGEKVRLRFINAAASTYFWLTFGGADPTLVSADGLDVVPVTRNRTLIGVAETYDFIVTIPESGKLEIRAKSQDGAGMATAYLGKGEVVAAEEVPRPDKIAMMQQMAAMDMKMGAPAIKSNPKEDERYKLKKKYGMDMAEMNGGSGKMKSGGTKHDMKNMKSSGKKEKMSVKTDSMSMQMSDDKGMQMSMSNMDMNARFNYDYLRAKEPTDYAPDAPMQEILLNLTGNMNRYIWSMNGVPISETDKIKIEEGQVTRLRLNNLTMMHHPMHLHGHFFRVINENGEYSPLKHTVNVAPMQEVTIEFYGNEYGDWFFHCHVLYHMMSGMARIFSYDTPRDPRMEDFPVKELIHETNQVYAWGTADVASHMSELNLVTADLRNQFNLSAELGYNKNAEAEASYEYYIYDYATVFVGVNAENEVENSLEEWDVAAIVGMRFLTPYLFNVDIRADHKLRPRIGIGREVMLFRRFSIFGYYEYQADFGMVGNAETKNKFSGETVWNAGAEYMLSRSFSLMASYDNRFGAGGGLSVRF